MAERAIMLFGAFTVSAMTTGALDRGNEHHRPANAVTVDFTLRNVAGEEILEEVPGTSFSVDLSAN